jgi:hypothetical protein
MTSLDPAKKRRNQMKAFFEPPRIATKPRLHGVYHDHNAKQHQSSGGSSSARDVSSMVAQKMILIPKAVKPSSQQDTPSSPSEEGFHALIMAASMHTSSSKSGDDSSADGRNDPEFSRTFSESTPTEMREPRVKSSSGNGNEGRDIMDREGVSTAADVMVGNNNSFVMKMLVDTESIASSNRQQVHASTSSDLRRGGGMEPLLDEIRQDHPPSQFNSLDYEDITMDISPTSIAELGVVNDATAGHLGKNHFFDEPFPRWQYLETSSSSTSFTRASVSTSQDHHRHPSPTSHHNDAHMLYDAATYQGGNSNSNNSHSIWRSTPRAAMHNNDNRYDNDITPAAQQREQQRQGISSDMAIHAKKSVSFQLTQSYSDYATGGNNTSSSNQYERDSPTGPFHPGSLHGRSSSSYVTKGGSYGMSDSSNASGSRCSSSEHYKRRTVAVSSHGHGQAQRHHHQVPRQQHRSRSGSGKPCRTNDAFQPPMPSTASKAHPHHGRTTKYEIAPKQQMSSFSTFVPPSPHQPSILSPHMQVSGGPPPPAVHLSKSWACDYCQASFPHYKAACAHEQECRLYHQRLNFFESRNDFSSLPPLDDKDSTGSNILMTTSDSNNAMMMIQPVPSLQNLPPLPPLPPVNQRLTPIAMQPTVLNKTPSRTSSIGYESIGTSNAIVVESTPSSEISSSAPYFAGCVPLALSKDSDWLSDVNCFVRKHCMEAFSAASNDVMTTSKRGRICLGQVGIRCKFCYTQPLKYRAIASVSFPVSISGIYESVKRWQRVHLPACQHVPPDIKADIADLQKSCAWIPTTRQYWSDSAKALGMVDTSEGIRFERDPTEPTRAEEFVLAISSDKPQTLMLPEDKKKVPPYVFTLIEQVQTCQFTEADRFLARSKCAIGFPGFECRHCSGHAGLGKYFPTTAKSLSTNSTSQNIHSHLMKCRRCPKEIKTKLEVLKDSKGKYPGLTHGWRRLFFDKIWGRLHNSKEQDGDDKEKKEVKKKGAV